MKILIFIVIFLLIGAFFIISDKNITLRKQGNLQVFLSAYKSWLFKMADNAIKTTGNIIKMEWLPE